MVTLSGNPNPTNPYMPCLFTTTEVSVRRQKSWEVGIWRIPVYTPDYSPVYSTVCGYWSHFVQLDSLEKIVQIYCF